jgi:hypothetical protein
VTISLFLRAGTWLVLEVRCYFQRIMSWLYRHEIVYLVVEKGDSDAVPMHPPAHTATALGTTPAHCQRQRLLQ